MTKLANFFIVGVAKAGTTALADILAQHPDIFSSKVKEPNYFSRDILLREKLYYGYQGVNSLDEYQACFREGQNHKIRLEASVSYFSYPEVAKSIKRYQSDAKVLIILRNPIKRAISHYLMDKRLGFVTVDLQDIFHNPEKHPQHFYQYFYQGLYFKRCEIYSSVFHANNLMIVEYQKDYRNLLPRLCKFLDISEGFGFDDVKSNLSQIPINRLALTFYRNKRIRWFLKSVIPKKIKNQVQKRTFKSQSFEVDEEFINTLNKFYEEDVQQLQSKYKLLLHDESKLNRY